VQQAIENAAGGRTIIAVAHRLSTIQNADVIFVIGSGRILEYGSHTALLSKRGMYYQMVRQIYVVKIDDMLLIWRTVSIASFGQIKFIEL
jgi:ABC-type transport system involved in cytochrome bd biosynthesis fused ATPase/permease subunit